MAIITIDNFDDLRLLSLDRHTGPFQHKGYPPRVWMSGFVLHKPRVIREWVGEPWDEKLETRLPPAIEISNDGWFEVYGTRYIGNVIGVSNCMIGV